jgi:murein DD-endopeptidase MepM/ murein hydrolase activator NlpD
MRHFLRYLLLLMFFSSCVTMIGQTQKWRDMHKVKKHETVFGIAKEYGLTIEELIDANPDMKVQGYELEKGDFIFIPYSKNAEERKPNSANLNKQNNKDSQENTLKKESNVLKIGVMLPLHDNDGDGKRMTEYYRGMLLALNQLKKEGISVDVHAWNVPIDMDIRQVLLDDNASKCDLIFGPLYTKQVKPLGDFCLRKGIKLIIPFSISGNDVETNPNIYEVYQNDKELNDMTIKNFINRFSNYHPVFIDCNDTTTKKGTFTFGLRNKLDAMGIKYSITNLKSSEAYFSKAFSRTKPNVIILNSGRSPELNVAIAKLDGLTSFTPGLSISLFGYTEWLMYTQYNLDNFFKYDTYIPTTFYYNPLSPNTQLVEKRYRWAYHDDMLSALPRFAITGYDQTMCFVRGYYANKGNSLNEVKSEININAIQTPYSFQKLKTGGYQNRSFMLVHYKNYHTIEALNY